MRTRQRSATALVSANLPLTCAFIAFVVMVSAQIASPLVDSALEALTTTVVVTLAIATFFVATNRLHMKHVLEVFLFTVVLALLAEAVGIRTGFPFGSYGYTGVLQPQLFGVPVIVPVAWFAMGLPAWEASRRLVRSTAARALVGGLLLAAWDLMLDPQMINNGYWTWDGSGFWQGVPLSNYLGWTVVGAVIVLVCERVFGSDPVGAPPNPLLVALYLWMGAFQALGFVLPFVFDRPEVGVVGGAAMVIPAVWALTTYRPSDWTSWRR